MLTAREFDAQPASRRSLLPSLAVTAVSARGMLAILAAALVLAAPTTARAATGPPGAPDRDRTTSTGWLPHQSTEWLLHTWAAAGQISGQGSLDSPHGRQLVAALQVGPRSVAAATRRPAAPRGRLPTCQGTWSRPGAATSHVQQSRLSIPWGVMLAPQNLSLGVVRFQAQIYADGYRANVYQPHVQWWSYQFHGYIPRTFSVVGVGVPHTMHPGTVVSFLWYWNSVTQPRMGGYAYLNCTYLS